MYSGPDSVATPGSTGVKVVIVGLGIAGLVAAVECYRKGHEVIGVEKLSNDMAVGMLTWIWRNMNLSLRSVD